MHYWSEAGLGYTVRCNSMWEIGGRVGHDISAKPVPAIGYIVLCVSLSFYVSHFAKAIIIIYVKNEHAVRETWILQVTRERRIDFTNGLRSRRRLDPSCRTNAKLAGLGPELGSGRARERSRVRTMHFQGSE